MLGKKLLKLLIAITLPTLVYTVSLSEDPITNGKVSKRFTLQDLLAGSQLATTPAVQEVQSNQRTQTIDIASLIAAAQAQKTAAAAANTASNGQPSDIISRYHKPIDIDVTADKDGNLNLADIPGLLSKSAGRSTDSDNGNLNNLQQVKESDGNNVVREELDLGKEKLEIEAAGKRAVHYSLVKGRDGGLNLVPVMDGSPQPDGHKFEVLQPKGYEEKGNSRQQMQLTTLSQALYSPFPSDQNTLHLHLKGKDGKDGKPGNKGSMGPMGPRGAAGPAGPKGDPGTCSAQKAPPPPFKPIGQAGTEGNPLPSCQAVFEKNPNSKSGPYWLMVNGVRFKTWCEFVKGGGDGDDDRPALAGGWTLVARVKGQATDWSPVSELWANTETLNEGTAADKKATISMKNVGYNLIKSNVLLLCFSSRNTHCAPMTHGKNMPLQRLFATQFGIVVEEQYTMATFLKALGKSCDLSIQRLSWCGMNLGNVCDAKKANPNEMPPKTTHIVRIGCIGDVTATCFPDDYAIGVGVTSCKDGYGCNNVGPSKNLHYRCDYVYGSFAQTAYIYVL